MTALNDMEFDVYSFTHPGGAAENQDAARAESEGGMLYAALCDGMSGMPQGRRAAQTCLETIFGGLVGAIRNRPRPQSPDSEPVGSDAFIAPHPQTSQPSAETVENALKTAHAKLLELQKAEPLCARAKTTGCALIAGNGVVTFATVGDSRVYIFSGDEFEASKDNSVAYAAYLRGEIPYSDIRMYPGRSALTACLGDERDVTPKSREVPLNPGDGMLLCSDGFWEYVYETEMQIDLFKAESAKDWAQAMLLRLAARSRLSGDNCTLIACIVRDPKL